MTYCPETGRQVAEGQTTNQIVSPSRKRKVRVGAKQGSFSRKRCQVAKATENDPGMGKYTNAEMCARCGYNILTSFEPVKPTP